MSLPTILPWARLANRGFDLPCPWCHAQTAERDTSCPGCGRRFG